MLTDIVLTPEAERQYVVAPTRLLQVGLGLLFLYFHIIPQVSTPLNLLVMV
jgi:hypothetical protein